MTKTIHPAALSPEQLRRRVDPAALPFETTVDVAPLETTIGQPRAFDAIRFGIGAETPGFHLFVAGAPGSGRESTVSEYVARFAATRPVPSDWIYVHNFAEPDRPIAISLPAGHGHQLKSELAALVSALRTEIPHAFESDDVSSRRDALLNAANEQKAAILTGLQTFAKERSFLLEMTPAGIMSIPSIDGKPVEKDAFQLLTDERKREIEVNGAALQERVGASLRQVRQIDKALADALKQMEIDVVTFVAAHRFEELRERYAAHAEVASFLNQIERDLPEHLHDFMPATPQDSGDGSLDSRLLQRNEHLARYEVNVLIDNGALSGAPVVVERNPSLPNLVGRTEYRSVFGAMVTDFRQIKPGALHRANGGFLILHAAELIRSPFAWETLIRTLECGVIEIENIADQVATIPAARLRPAAIPLDIKVVLIGSPVLYQMLFQLDEDFPELFPVKADFALDMNWTDEHAADYAAFISRQVRENGLRHLDRGAVARVIEEGGRHREHQSKLTTKFLAVANLVAEASYWAGEAGRDVVSAEDVATAVAKRTYRSNLVEERLQELIVDGTIHVATEGERIGQINGLAVLDSGDYAFGKPSRVSARVAVGRGVIHSIEREIELSGPIHSKGFLILSGYLQGQYGTVAPLALSATITFEQAYEGIDGDSASSTELYALLSALAEMPLKQAIAVTGSVNQFGDVQAVGGVTRKIEGFFAVCQARGLTGEQGVMIPATNVQNLMLSPEVVQAAAAGKFHIWPIRTIDEGITLLTGQPAETVHARVAARLAGFLQAADAHAAEPASVNGRKPAKSKKKSPAKAGKSR